jgi:class 3 adenylate cyclase
VNCATVFFTDIYEFSSYCQGLLPQQTIGALQTIFVALDDLLPTQHLVMRVKCTRDFWMGAPGLFGEHQPVDHAEQAVRLSLEALTVMDEVNAKLEANLHVRIGINTGGPLLSGVLGTDEPMLDIIGDPIDIAARLQTSGSPGRIQISEDTREIVKVCRFSIEPRDWFSSKTRATAWRIGSTQPRANARRTRAASAWHLLACRRVRRAPLCWLR